MLEKQEENIDSLASKANEIMAENKYYHKKLSLYEKYINMTKDVITNILSKNDIESAIECFNKYIEEIQKDYDNMNKLYEKNELREYNELIETCFNETMMGKPYLNNEKKKQFLNEYEKMEKDDIIKDLKRSIKKSKEFQLFREPTRYTLIEMKEGAKEIEKTTNELQQNMLYELKKCNKFKERIIKYNEQMKEIEKNIDILKDYMKHKNPEDKKGNKTDPDFDPTNTDPKKSYNPTTTNRSGFNNHKRKYKEDNNGQGGSEERKKKRRSKLKLIEKFPKIKDLFEISDVENDKENIIYDELNSDEEIVFQNKIKQPIKLTELYFDEIKKEIPEINLAQIQYNKMKEIKEDDLYSIQRRKYKNQNLDNNIKELKKDIEKKEQQIELIQKKERAMKEYIEKVEKTYSDLKKYSRKKTSVYNKDIKFLKKSLLYKGGENIKEEETSEEGDKEIGSDYENEQNEEDDFAKGKQSVFVGNEQKDRKINKGLKNNPLGKSVRDDMFKNNLRNKLKHIKANSK